MKKTLEYKKPKLTKKKLVLEMLSKSSREDFADSLLTESLMLAAYGGCILPGTKIALSSHTSTIVEDINTGVIIKSYDHVAKKIVTDVVNKLVIHPEGADSYVEINNLYRVTPNHRILINDSSWKRAEELRINDYITTLNGVVKIFKIEMKQKNIAPVYNIEVQNKNGNYFADGMCIHW